MSTQTDKIRAALEYVRMRWDTHDGQVLEIGLIDEALSELEAQPQPANEGAEPVAWCVAYDGSGPSEGRRIHSNPTMHKPEAEELAKRAGLVLVNLYTTPQPAKVLTEADVIAWLEEKRMMWKGLGVSTRNVKDHELIPIPELLLRYARDNGYLAPAQRPHTGRDLHSEVSTMDMLFALHKVIAEFRDKRQHGDLFFQPLGGQAERLAQLHDELDAWLKTAPAQPPAPTVSKIMEVAWPWIMQTHGGITPPTGSYEDLKDRLTKLMQP